MIMREHVALRLPRLGLLTIALLALTALPAWSQRAENTTTPDSREAAARAMLEEAKAALNEAQAALARSAHEHDVNARAKGKAYEAIDLTASDALVRSYMALRAESPKPLPDEAQKLLDAHQRQQAEATTALVDQLQRLQRRYAAEGRIDQAEAVAARIRQFQQPRGGIAPAGPWGLRTGGIAPRGGAGAMRVLPDPGC